MTVKEGLTSPRFYFLSWLLFQGIFFGIYMASVYKVCAIDVLDDMSLTIAGAIGSVCNGGSRIMWASLQDKFGFKTIYFILMAIQFICAATIWYARQNSVFYIIVIGFSYLCEGGHFSMFPTVAVHIFGLKNGGQIYTFMFFFIAFSALASYGIV